MPTHEPQDHDLADRFLQLACLTYTDVGPAEWAEAATMLVERPDLVEGSVYGAAAAADVAALGRVLDADPTAARRAGGPHGWEPLMYLAYARHDPAIAETDVLDTARLLLASGADPDAGGLWFDMPTPFTVLTGVFGEGEMGPALQPRHPHSLSFGRLLLEAGADPNDAQTLYNRMFGPDDDHLELLLEFGLGTGDGGPWRARLGDQLEAPAAQLRGQLAWAITHGMTHRVQLLVDHGVDLTAPMTEHMSRGPAAWASNDGDEPTPSVIAAMTGHPDLVGYLVSRGAAAPALTPAGTLVSALLAADRPAVDRLIVDDPVLVDHLRSERTGIVAWAAAVGRRDAVALLAELGFDINAMGRGDVPSNERWQTALHTAVDRGDAELVELLLRLGADPNIADARFRSTPLGWSQYFERPELTDLLAPVTTLRPDAAPD